MMETPLWVQLANLVAAVLFILTLKGLSHPKTARRGVMLGALGAAIATFVVFFSGIPTDNLILILVALHNMHREPFRISCGSRSSPQNVHCFISEEAAAEPTLSDISTVVEPTH